MHVRVLGVDPGLTRCGLGVVEGLPGRRVRLIAVGVVRTPPDDEPQNRLLSLQTELDQWLVDHRPDAIAVERVFARSAVRSIMGTAQASAVPLLAGARLGLPVTTYTPTEVKASVTGSGRAQKPQVTAMITRILGLEQPPKPADAADALALAICHVWRGGAEEQRRTAAQLASARSPGATGLPVGSGPTGASAPARNRLQELHAAHAGARR